MACRETVQLVAPVGSMPTGDEAAAGRAANTLEPDTKIARPDGTGDGDFGR